MERHAQYVLALLSQTLLVNLHSVQKDIRVRVGS